MKFVYYSITFVFSDIMSLCTNDGKTNSCIRTVSLKEQQNKQGIAIFALLGSVAAGKTSLCKFLTNESTQKHSAELVNGCTINLGYKNVKIYHNEKTREFLLNPKEVPSDFILLRHFSIADNPGHNSFMATMITGTTNLDCTIFLVSGTEGVELQTYQHFRCFKSTNNKNLAMIVSKIDLIPTEIKLRTIIKQIDELMESEELDEDIDPPILPVSSFSKINMDKVIKYLLTIPYPKKSIDNLQSLVDSPTKMSVVRSFDINKPGTTIDKMQGSVVGGVIQSGFLTIGDIICLIPGVIEFNLNNESSYSYTPLVTQVLELQSDKTILDIAIPGGFIAVKTTLDPSLSKANGLVGQTIIKISSQQDLTKQHNYVVSNVIYVSSLQMLEQSFKLINENRYIVVVNTSARSAILKNTCMVNNVMLYQFETVEPVGVFENVRIAILSCRESSIDYSTGTQLIGYGMSFFNYTEQQKIAHKLQSDIDVMLSSLSNNVSAIKLIDDLPNLNNVDEIMEELFDIEKSISNIDFSSRSFVANYTDIVLEKTTTSISVANAEEIFLSFTKDELILRQLLIDFAQYLIISYGDDLKTTNIDTSNGRITFHDIKRANRKFFTNDFNKKLADFVTAKFTCKTCKANGSMLFEKKQHICRSCNAVSMIKS